jgi:histidinol dehydrogenase
MNIILNPDYSLFESICKRPSFDQKHLSSGVQTIFDEISRRGDQALIEYTQKYDNVKIKSTLLNFNDEQVEISSALKDAIQVAYKNIKTFHETQIPQQFSIPIMPGIVCSQKPIPIQNIGVYIPGGTAPLFSTVLMLCIPAKLAGCKRILLCTPPDKSGNIHPAILYAAQLCGVTEIRLAGGAQAIAAMALGTQEIQKVDKIFGPGNQYVTAAKQLAQNYGVSIDMPAGPSELLVFADETAIPAFVAADLLSQAEHGSDSQVVLIATSEAMVKDIFNEIESQLVSLPRKEIAKEALKNSKFVIMTDANKAFDLMNHYAPEHLIIASDNPEQYIDLIINAGSVFLGNYCPESAGDYASGTNHTLPTNGWAKNYSGVNMDAFYKKVTFQSITKQGIENLGQTIITMAEGEALQAHANAVKVRLIQKS